MKRLWLLGFFLLKLPLSVFGQSYFSSEVDSLILCGIDQTFNSRFDSAMATFQEVVDLVPDQIVGTFYQVATLQSKMMDYETDQWEDQFFDLMERAIRQGERQIKEQTVDPWTYFYLGNTYSYKGLYLAKRGSLIPGIKSARKGTGYLKSAVKLDRDLYDAYLGLGNYKYWSGRITKYLKWLPGISDERSKGIEMVEMAVEKGKFSRWVGINSLAWIEYDRKAYMSALDFFQMGLEKYPGSRFFLWGIADTYYKIGNYGKAILVYDNLLESIRKEEYNNGYNEVVCRFKMIKCLMEEKEYRKAIFHCDIILNKRVSDKIGKRINGRRNDTKNFKKKCLRELGKDN